LGLVTALQIENQAVLVTFFIRLLVILVNFLVFFFSKFQCGSGYAIFCSSHNICGKVFQDN